MAFLSIFSIRFVYVWDVNSRSLQYKLPGHMGSVNEVQFYPDSKEPISESLLPITNSFVNRNIFIFSCVVCIRQGDISRRNSTNFITATRLPLSVLRDFYSNTEMSLLISHFFMFSNGMGLIRSLVSKPFDSFGSGFDST